MTEKFEFAFLTDFDPNEIEIATKEQRWAEVIKQWMDTDAKTLKFSLKNIEEKGRCRTAVNKYLETHNLDYTVYSEKNKNNIYVVRA